jgi:hypothetical protein
LANAQADTTQAAHDSTAPDGRIGIDFGRAGAGYNRKIFVTINKTFTSGGSATDTFAVVTDDNSSFSSATTLFTTGALAYSTLTAGKKVLEYTLPAEVEQYIKVIHTIGTAALTDGKWNAWVDDVQQTNMTIM